MEGEPEDFIDRMDKELQDLSAKCMALVSFMISDEAKELTFVERELMRRQHNAMIEYSTVLHMRLSLYIEISDKQPE